MSGCTSAPQIPFHWCWIERPSALARNDPTLLAKSDPPPPLVGGALLAGKPDSCPRANASRLGPAAFRRSIISPRPAVPCCDMRALRAFGADDGRTTRTPSAWMILLAQFLALWQIVFFVWVSLSERKWVILAERRGTSAAMRIPSLCCCASSVVWYTHCITNLEIAFLAQGFFSSRLGNQLFDGGVTRREDGIEDQTSVFGDLITMRVGKFLNQPVGAQ